MFSHSMKRNANKPSRALLMASAVLAASLAFAAQGLLSQSPQTACSNKPQDGSNAGASGTPNTASSSPSPTTTSQPEPSRLVWVNTQAGTYHKQGTRWYGKTKHGKYMLEADALKAGYKPAK
jgi:hypothetical protein